VAVKKGVRKAVRKELYWPCARTSGAWCGLASAVFRPLWRAPSSAMTREEELAALFDRSLKAQAVDELV
jgi:hypothetical protein